MELLDQYLNLKKQIHEYFGYSTDWVEIPLEDYRSYHWILQQEPAGRGELLYYDSEITAEVLTNGKFYQNEIYTQRFLPRWVYRGKDYTLVSVDTRTDGNKFLAVLDNAKEQTMTSALAQALRKSGF